MPLQLPWHTIDNVLLDMDGTLLDLHFDNHFWLEHVPLRYAQRHDLDLDTAKAALRERYRAVEGRIEWYCVDYWTRELALDIATLKREVEHLIAVRPQVLEFLDRTRASGKRITLVTNAHQKALDLKLQRTQLGGHFDALICAHTFGRPKEDPQFWDWLRAREPFHPERTLFVDDSLPVLRAARDYGIRHLLCVRQPDSRGPHREIAEFPALNQFDEIFPDRVASPL
ncbi:MAG: GMP/IMP nucleotidase [Gammaproteobacteria bacterium]